MPVSIDESPGKRRPMIEDTSPTVIGTIDHRVVLLGQQAQLLDVLLGDAQLHGLIAARRLDPLGRLANALGRGALDDRDGGARPHRLPLPSSDLLASPPSHRLLPAQAVGCGAR